MPSFCKHRPTAAVTIIIITIVIIVTMITIIFTIIVIITMSSSSSSSSLSLVSARRSGACGDTRSGRSPLLESDSLPRR